MGRKRLPESERRNIVICFNVSPRERTEIDAIVAEVQAFERQRTGKPDLVVTQSDYARQAFLEFPRMVEAVKDHDGAHKAFLAAHETLKLKSAEQARQNAALKAELDIANRELAGDANAEQKRMMQAAIDAESGMN